MSGEPGDGGGMWDELGIAPSTTLQQIRRAYATRLKAIDGDRDGAAFMRLRRAFEAAMAWAERNEDNLLRAPEGFGPDAAPGRPEATSTAQSTVAAASNEHGAASETGTALADCRRAIAAGDLETAFGLVQGAFAKGYIPVAEDSGLFAELMAVAVDDRSLPAERFREMARFGDWHRAPVDWNELRYRVIMRLDAESWYEGLIVAKSRSGGAAGFFGSRLFGFRTKTQRYWLSRSTERFEARILLDLSWPWIYWQAYLDHMARGRGEPRLKKMLVQYARFEPWIAHRFDAKRLAGLREVTAMPGWKRRVMSIFFGAFIGLGASATILAILFGVGMVVEAL
jgi:hypothetical protein